ncbi:MAG: precorrin-6Y C5,15-methyltransferase (decarboxylating) subunit CbiT [Thermovenabulum sp.]|uniref:precorrin-6Y C5,15-methyltransferase (decarboxylating) subunit CbiT n=1 Tax=Thermovenabulum sp. TaxID=3100335 RepID=UPI003C7EC5C8
MWLKDEDFIRGNIPMTKYEIRAVTVAYLEINKNDVLLDIGAGTGSISLQSALLGAKVIAVDREDEAVEIIKKNAEKFGVSIDVIKGDAVEVVDKVFFNKCFIGGSGGKIEILLEKIDTKLPPYGIVVANFIKQDNACRFIEKAKNLGYKVSSGLINISLIDDLGLFKAYNPIMIVKAVKK